MDLDALRALLDVLKDHDVRDFTYDDGTTRYALTIGGDPVVPVAPTPVVTAAAAAVPSAPPPSASAAPPAEEGIAVKAPVVGTFYAAPSPDASPFVAVGQRVDKGQVLCIIEAMKLMNEIEAETAGTVVACLVEDGTPVEYGQPIFRIRPG